MHGVLHFLENVAGTDWMFTVPESYVDRHRSGFSNSQASPGEGNKLFWAYATNNRKPERDRNQK
jgi:hypothetical protein